MPRLLAVAAALAATASLSASPSLHRFEFEQPHMGTLWRIVLYAPDAQRAEEASDRAFERIAQLDALLSDYRSDSELNRVTREAVDSPVPVSAELFDVLLTAQTMARQTDGAFDMTAGALTHAWRRARRLGRPPSDEEMAAARARSGYQLLELDASARTVRFRRAGMQLDAGGIGKGYAADQASRALRTLGVTRALVAGGGDIVAGDPPPGASGWEVRLAGWDGEVLAFEPLMLARAAVSTSGDTEQWLDAGGVRHSHIIDPRTGRAVTGRRLVTAVASNAITSDMLATAASVLDPADAVRLADDTPDAAVLIGTPDPSGRVEWTRSARWAAVSGWPEISRR